MMSAIEWELPRDWKSAQLGDCATDITSGFACAKKHAVPEGLPHLRPFNVGTDGELDLSELVRIPEEFKDGVERYYLETGDVLFNNTNSVELVGKTAIVREPVTCAFSNHMTRLRVDQARLMPKWLVLTLRQLWVSGFFAAQCRKWIGQAGFNTTMLKDVEIPLPPLDEQRRIVARIEELFARIEEARHLRYAANEDVERLSDAALAEIFEEPEAKHWIHKAFADVWSEKARYGSFRKPQAKETIYPVIRVGNLVDNTLALDDLKYLDLSKHELERCELGDGDLVIARAIGSRAHLGKCAVFRASMAGKTFVLDSHLIRVRLNKTQVDPDFLCCYLSSSFGRNEILQNSRQSAIQFNINVRELGMIAIPVPSLLDQHRIVEYLEDVHAQVTELESLQAHSTAELERLEQSILARAFRGEL